MGVSDGGRPLELSGGKWVPIFLRAVGEAQIRREGYLCSRASSGELACKACGCYLPYAIGMDAHFKEHLLELDNYLAEQAIVNEKAILARREAKKQERAEAKAAMTASEQVDEFLVL